MNEEEAIEQLKIIKNNIDKKYINTKNSNAIQTVLNLLENKDINIIEAKEANRQLSIELQKKDKIIDLIAGELANYKHEEIICMEVDCKHIELQNEGKCIGDKECIKEYYERKVENGN